MGCEKIKEAPLKRRFPPSDLIVGSPAIGETAPMNTIRFQAGVIAIRDGMTCLVTNRRGSRWIIPKGTIEPKQSASDAAHQEAWQEAGLLGSLSLEPFGLYQVMKKLKRCHVTVYLLYVSECRDTWPEMSKRQREWFPFNVAAERVKHSGLRQLIDSLSQPTAIAVA